MLAINGIQIPACGIGGSVGFAGFAAILVLVIIFLTAWASRYMLNKMEVHMNKRKVSKKMSTNTKNTIQKSFYETMAVTGSSMAAAFAVNLSTIL